MEKFIFVECCDSTQDLLKEQLTQLDTFDLTVGCQNQLNGRGRGDHSWRDSRGTICFSMTISAHSETSFTALEISTIIARFFQHKGQSIKLKWPNDLINLKGKKCGGILIQNTQQRFIAGIGINLFYESTEFGGIYQDIFELDKKSWIQELSQYIRANRYTNTQSLVRDWTGMCHHLNRRVQIVEGSSIVEGLFIGLGPYGEACVKSDDGIKHIFNGSLITH